MSVTRINEFHAQPDKGQELYNLVTSFMPMIKSSQGCISFQLLRDMNDPDRIVVIEVWESVEYHQASTKNIPQEALHTAMQLMAGPPKGSYLT